MNDSTPHLTVEDAGSTTDPADLIDSRPEGDDRIADHVQGDTAPGSVTGRMLDDSNDSAGRARSDDMAAPPSTGDAPVDTRGGTAGSASTWSGDRSAAGSPTAVDDDARGDMRDDMGSGARLDAVDDGRSDMRSDARDDARSDALPPTDRAAAAEPEFAGAPAADRTADERTRIPAEAVPGSARDTDRMDTEAGRPQGGADTDTAPMDEAPADDAGGETGSASAFANLGSLGDVGHVFDQTNGMVDRLDGDSDGTAESDDSSAAERENDWHPIGAQDTYAEDHGLTKRDPNP